MLSPGQNVDRYVVEVELGTGAMANVYRVRHRTLGTLHALKLLHAAGPAARSRLVQEGRLQARLKHPNIVPVTDVLDVEGEPGLLLDLVEGPSLEAWLQGRSLPLEEAERLFLGVLDGLEHAHAQSCVHRDLKPANILLAKVGDTWVPRITDFGIAKVLEGGLGMGDTRAGAQMGTPRYMAPEQVNDSSSVDLRADVFAAGCVLFELLAGRRAFEGDDIVGRWSNMRQGRHGPLPAVPERLRRAVEGALQPDPTRRIPDCRVFRQVLVGEVERWAAPAAASRTLSADGSWSDAPEAAEAAPGTTSPPAPPEPVPRAPPAPPRRRVGRWLLGAVGALALLGAGLGVAWQRAGWATPTRVALCLPQPEVPSDGIDQDCDGVDRRPIFLLDQGGRLVLHGGDLALSPPLRPGARLLPGVAGPWLVEPGEGALQFRRVHDGGRLGEALTVPVLGPVGLGDTGDVFMVTAAGEDAVYRVDLAAPGEPTAAPAVGFRAATGRAGTSDFWGIVQTGDTWALERRNPGMQPLGRWPLPGPAPHLLASGPDFLAAGDWGVGVLHEEQLEILPLPEGFGSPETLFEAVGAAWVASADGLAKVDLAAKSVRVDPAAPFQPRTRGMGAAWDADRDGVPTEADPPDCDDLDPALRPGSADVDGDGVDSDCDGKDSASPHAEVGAIGTSRSRWVVYPASDFTRYPASFEVQIGERTWASADGGPIEIELPAGTRGDAVVRAEGFVDTVRPFHAEAARFEEVIYALARWQAEAGPIRYGYRLEPGESGMATVAVRRGDYFANFPGVRFDVEPAGPKLYMASGPLDGQAVNVQPEYGWPIWAKVPVGTVSVRVTPPDGVSCWLPGEVSPIRGPVPAAVQQGRFTHFWVVCR